MYLKKRSTWYLASEVGPPRHAHGHVLDAVPGELAGGDAVAEVGVVVVGAALVRADLVPQLLGVEGECLTWRVQRQGSAWVSNATTEQICFSEHF